VTSNTGRLRKTFIYLLTYLLTYLLARPISTPMRGAGGVRCEKARSLRRSRVVEFEATRSWKHGSGRERRESGSLAASQSTLVGAVLIGYARCIVSEQLPPCMVVTSHKTSAPILTIYPHILFTYVSVLPVHAPTTSTHSVNSPLSPSITPSFTPGSRPTSFTSQIFPP